MKITKYVYNLYCSPCSIEGERGRTRAISRNLGILRPNFVNSALPILSFHSNQTLLIKSVFNFEQNAEFIATRLDRITYQQQRGQNTS